jgi:hypothetical protein
MFFIRHKIFYPAKHKWGYFLRFGCPGAGYFWGRVGESKLKLKIFYQKKLNTIVKEIT